MHLHTYIGKYKTMLFFEMSVPSMLVRKYVLGIDHRPCARPAMLASLAQGCAPVFPAWQSYHAHSPAEETEAQGDEGSLCPGSHSSHVAEFFPGRWHMRGGKTAVNRKGRTPAPAGLTSNKPERRLTTETA